MSSLEDDLKQKSENEEISVKTNDEQGNGAPTGSDSSSINNEFCLVNEVTIRFIIDTTMYHLCIY